MSAEYRDELTTECALYKTCLLWRGDTNCHAVKTSESDRRQLEISS